MNRSTKVFFSIGIACLSFSILAADIRDPTRPPDAYAHAVLQEPEKELFVVNAILVSKTRQLAVINGEMVQVGDLIGNARVLKIMPDYVSLKTSGTIKKYLIFMNDTVLNTTRK